ncbi:hypothetical protein BGZ72_001069 [Mortierella alpina]|nr:hypothetical protein BGZ72_001069 [Mortierella alpina]
MSNPRIRHGPSGSSVPNNLVPEVPHTQPITHLLDGAEPNIFDDSPMTHPETRPDWAIALENQAVSLRHEIRDEMAALEQRLYDGVSSIIVQHNGSRDRPAENLPDSQTMRTPKPLVADDTTDEEPEAGPSHRAPRQHARPSGRQAQRPPDANRHVPGGNQEEYMHHHPTDIELYRRTLERIKSYDGPAFFLSRKKGKYADDWIRGFDNWFRGKVCDPNIDDSAIRTGVIRLVMTAVGKHTEASEWCRIRAREKNMTYKILMEDLSDTFMDLDEARRRIQIDFLQEFPQTANERIAKYNVRFKTRVDLHRAACARARRVPDERSLLSCYAAGLFDSHQRYIALRQGDWQSAMEYMRELGSRYNEVELARKPSKATKESDSEDSEEEDDNRSDEEASKRQKDRVKPPTGRWDTMHDDLKAVTEQLGALTVMMGKQQRNLPARTPGPPRVTPPDVKCFNCEEMGHYSSKCTKPRRPRTLMAQQWYQASQYDDEEHAREYACYLSAVDLEEYTVERSAAEEQDF